MNYAPNTDDGSQALSLLFLSNPMSYSPPPQKVDRIDTHGATVFLAGNQAFKMKRAVSFSYMDFSTLNLRYRACKRELELNSPHAPQIYQGLAAITQEQDGSLTFNGKGKIIEWLVQMVRFREHDVLKNLATLNPLSDTLSQTIAEKIFRYHEDAPRYDCHKSEEHLQETIKDVFKTLETFVPDLDLNKIIYLKEQCLFHYQKTFNLLQRRQQEGSIRRCHGDLHLSNIVLIENNPVLFDALEFNEEMAIIDILYDLSFLLMDLDHFKQRNSANVILNRYLWLSARLIDIEGLELLPLFMSLRAAIRGMVRAQRALQASDVERPSLLKLSKDYIDQALSYLKKRSPCLILIGGLSGTGKSTLASRLAPLCGQSPGALYLRSDLERKRLFSVSETEHLPENYYTSEINSEVYTRILTKAELALRAGHAVIADAVYAKSEEREQMEALAKKCNAELYTFWLEAPTSVLLARVASRRLDASDATGEVVMKQRHYDIGPLKWDRIDAQGGPDEVFSQVKERLKECLDTT